MYRNEVKADRHGRTICFLFLPTLTALTLTILAATRFSSENSSPSNGPAVEIKPTLTIESPPFNINPVTCLHGTALAVSYNNAPLANAQIRLFDLRLKVPTVVFAGHLHGVNCMTFDSKGKVLVSGGGSSDPSIRIWNVKTGKEIAELSGHNDGICSLSFSDDDKMVISAGYDGTIRLWEMASWKCRAILLSDGLHFAEAVVSPNSRFIAVRNSNVDQRISIWDVRSCRKKSILAGHQQYVTCFRFITGDRMLVSGSVDRSTRTWNVETGNEFACLQSQKGPIWAIGVSKSGDEFVSAGDGRTINVWHAKSRTKDKELIGRGFTVGFASLTFCEEDSLLAAGSFAGDITVWDFKSTREIVFFSTHDSKITSMTYCEPLSTLVTSGADGLIKLWDLRSAIRESRKPTADKRTG